MGEEAAQSSCSALMAELVGSGVLVLDRRGEPLFANALARRLLGGAVQSGEPCEEQPGERLSGQVKYLLSLLDSALGSATGGEGAGPPARAAVPWPPPVSSQQTVSPQRVSSQTPPSSLAEVSASASASLHIEMTPLAGDPRRGYVVVLNDGDATGQLVDELLTASRMRARDYIYHALLHDLRAPLNALEINLELLADNCARVQGHIPESTDQHQLGQGLSVLREELARLNRTLRVVLDGGELFQPRAENFDLAETLREVALLLSPQAKQQRVVIQLQFPDAVVLVDGHRDRLKQAFINIAVNALEAMPDGGRLTVAIERDGDAVHIRFSDDGCGISERLREQVFDACFTTKRGGHGMGLFVARLVARAHGGEVRIDGRAAGGSTIEFALPTVVRG